MLASKATLQHRALRADQASRAAPASVRWGDGWGGREGREGGRGRFARPVHTRPRRRGSQGLVRRGAVHALRGALDGADEHVARAGVAVLDADLENLRVKKA